jgi:hypothetical protein
MKTKLIIFLLLFPCLSFAAPFGVTNNFTRGTVLLCHWTLNGTDTITDPVADTSDTTLDVCRIDVAAATPGTNSISVYFSNMYEVSTTFSTTFTRPITKPPNPAAIYILLLP